MQYNLLEKFAHPSAAFKQEMIETTKELKAVYNRQLIDSFIEANAGNVIERMNVFSTFVSIVQEYENLISVPFHIISLLRKGVNDNSLSISMGAVVSFLLYYQASEERCLEWDATDEKGINIYVDDHYLEGIVQVTSCNGNISLYRNGKAGDVEEIDIKLSGKSVTEQGIVLLTAYPDNLLFEGNQRLTPGHQLTDIQQTFRAALKILQEDASLYYEWVTSVTEVVVFVEGNSRFIYSGSDLHYPGIINISYPSTSITMAEMLVHESSHQYWFMGQWFEDIVNGRDEHLYFSPIKNCDRPLWAIHTAYHAFSNVLLFYDLCLKASIQDDGYCKKNIPVLIDQMNVLQKVLESTDGLTETGEHLWRPLAEQLKFLKCC